MKKDTIYTFFIILIIGMFSTNFIFFQMNNKTLFGGTTISIITGSILLIKDRVEKRQNKK